MKEVFSDQELIDGIQIHDTAVLEFMYKKNYRSVKHYIENHNGSEEDAQDVFQDAMIFLHHKVSQNELILKSSIHSYLFGVTKMLWLRGLERKKRYVFNDHTEMSVFENFLDDMIILERKKIFINHFSELSKDCQRLIGLFIKKTGISEITNLMGYNSEQYTRNKRLRCKKSLLKRIMQDPYFKNQYQ